MKRLLIILCLQSTIGYAQQFEFPSKEGKLSLFAPTGLIAKNNTTKFDVKSNDGIDPSDLTIIAINGSIAHSGPELHLNVGGQSLIYLLAMETPDGSTELRYYDLIGIPIAANEYPYIAVWADNVPLHVKRGIPGNTKNLRMQVLYSSLQGSCQRVFVNQISASFTDRQREVGSAREQGNEVQIGSLLTRGASPHLHIKVKAESIGCTDKNGVLKIINPQISRTFTYSVTASNLEKDVAQIISHMNAENRQKATAQNDPD